MNKVSILRGRGLAALLVMALVFTVAPTVNVFADGTHVNFNPDQKVTVKGQDVYYVTSDESDVEIDFGDSGTVEGTKINDTNIWYAVKDGGIENYYYGSADIEYPDYWENENLTAPSNDNWTKSSDKVDSEGFHDMGGFDTVTRSTRKHGTYRAAFQFITDIYGYANEGANLTKFKSEHDGIIGETGTMTLKARDEANTDVVSMADMAQNFTVAGIKYTYDHYDIRGIQRVPVKINGNAYIENLILKKEEQKYIKKIDDFNLDGTDGSGRVVDERTGNVKELKKDGKYGPVSAGTKTTLRSAVVEDTEDDSNDSLERVTTLNYNHAYGEYVTAEVGLRNKDQATMSKADMYHYVSKFTSATYEYFGDDSSYGDAKATYGSMGSADTWWSFNHGARIDAGFMFDSYRLGSPDGHTKNKQFGYWRVTFRSAGYEDVVSEFYLGPEIKFEKETVTMDKGATDQIQPVLGNKSKVKNSRYESSDTNIVTVDNDGKITATGSGDAVITYHQNEGVDGDLYEYATYKVKVNESELALDKTNATLYPVKGYNTLTLKATVKGPDSNVAWSTSNSKIATVNNGKVIAKKAGTVTITAKANGKTAQAKITVKKPSYKINKKSINLKKGKKFKIKVTKKAPAGKVTYKSKNKKVATVTSKGVIKAKKKGATKITVKCNGVTKTIKVKVK